MKGAYESTFVVVTGIHPTANDVLKKNERWNSRNDTTINHWHFVID